MKRSSTKFTKDMHAAVDPIFKHLAKQIENSIDGNQVLKEALQRIDELEAEVAALRKKRTNQSSGSGE